MTITELIRATDNLRLLHQVEAATGRKWTTESDRYAVLHAHQALDSMRKAEQ